MATQSSLVIGSPQRLQGVGLAAWLWSGIGAAERVFAAIALLVALPALFACAIAIATLSRRSPLIAHRRVGLNGRPIWVLKFRTMWGGNRTEAKRLKVIEWVYPVEGMIPAKCQADPRIKSAFAAFCRKYSIDEVPQLWNVLRGEMALVGPRPLTKEEIEHIYGSRAREVLMRKPGLTGLWQVRGRSRLTYPQRRRFDLLLVKRLNFSMYLYILSATIPNVITGKNAW